MISWTDEHISHATTRQKLKSDMMIVVLYLFVFFSVC